MLPVSDGDASPPRSATERALAERLDDTTGSPGAGRAAALALTTAGVAFTLSVWGGYFAHSFKGVGVGALIVAVQLVLFVPLALAAVAAGARMFDLSFGSLASLLIKLVAITLGTGAVADVLLFGLFQQDFEWTYIPVGFLFYIICCGIPLTLMFKTDLQETAAVVGLMAAPRIAALLCLRATFPEVFGAS